MHNGYVGIGENWGVFVPREEALEYALMQCGVTLRYITHETEAFCAVLQEWYFSGDWLLEGQAGNKTHSINRKGVI